MSSNNTPKVGSYKKHDSRKPIPATGPLPYARVPTHLHQSMLRLLEENPVEFYLQEMAPEGTVPDFQSVPAAIGCAFDAHVKSLIARVANVACPSLKKLMENVDITGPDREVAINKGRWLLAGYVESGALTALLEERPQSLDLHLKRAVNDVPCEGTLDATTCGPFHKSKPAVVVHDWKTTGTNRPGEVSPHPGYLRLFDTDGPGVSVGPHTRHAEPLERLDERWAMQVTVYGFLIGHEPDDHMASIDEIIAGRDGRVRVAQYRTHVTKKFQKQMLVRLKRAWKQIQRREVVPADLAAGGLDFVKAMR